MPGPGLKPEIHTNAKHSPECVLLIDAEASDAARILEELGSSTGERFDVEWVPELSSGLGRLRNGGVGTVLFDMTSPDSRAIETFDRLFQAAPGVPILILVGADAEEMARKAVQHGAQDYLVKNPADGYRLRRAVRAMMERRSADAVLLENQVANVTLDSIGEAVLRTDKHGNVAYLNRIAGNLIGWREGEESGRRAAEVLRIVDPVNGATVRDALEIVMREEKTAGVTAHCMHCILVRRD